MDQGLFERLCGTIEVPEPMTAGPVPPDWLNDSEQTFYR
jgi:hypothetical protein